MPYGTGDSPDIVARCTRLGFALAGVCRATPSQYQAELRAWLAAGSHGDMHFLEEDAAVREDPSCLTCVVAPGDNRARDGLNDNVLAVRSFIVVADLYASRGSLQDLAPSALDTTPSGRIARYAQGKDYHQVMKRRLHALSDELRAAYPGEGFVTFVDTVPLPERELASMAGLGWVGKHTLLINRALGSWFFLGGVGTSLVLDPPSAQQVDTDHCGTCTRCIDACPTSAITDHRVDAKRCLSYLTIEHQGLIPVEHHAAIGDWLYGCDICQNVCPHNSDRGRDPGGVPPRSEYAPGRSAFSLLEVLGWTEADRNHEFRHSAMKRISLEMMKRNAIVVAGNHLRCQPDQALRDRIAKLAEDEAEAELVRQTAAEVVRALTHGAALPRPRPPPSATL